MGARLVVVRRLDRQDAWVEVVAYNVEAGLMSVRVGDSDAVSVLDKDDLVIIGVVVVRLVAEGRAVDPAILLAILRGEG
jgi:hypothetical protein